MSDTDREELRQSNRTPPPAAPSGLGHRHLGSYSCMPTELPGFYWDEQRNRYFPVSSRPKTAPTSTVPPVAAHPTEGPRKFLPTHGRRRRPHALWDLTETFRNTVSYSKRNTLNHDILLEHYARTSSLRNSIVPTFGTIKSFNSIIVDEQWRQFIGDSHGWLYSSTFDVEEDWNASSWSAELNLQFDSEISTVCISGNHCVATCFGSTTRFSLMDLTDPARTSLFRLNSVYDVRAAHLDGSSLALGAKAKAVYVSDINVFPPVQVLDTQSDVFSICKQTDLVYTGSRNGNIHRFDLRIAKPRGQLLFDARNDVSSPVLHLSTIRDFEMLVSRMNGDLTTFDLRFLRLNLPILQFPEHVNTITHRLGIAVDPTEEFLFAAGEDRRLRGWSLRTGLALATTRSSSSNPGAGERRDTHSRSMISPSISTDLDKPFQAIFERPIESLKATNDTPQGPSLWATCGRDLLQYNLGQCVPAS